ncbi:hypothetical protein TrRE_jg848 [Triparma retinervis]|uniref:4-hydroxy-tetrahydrodipicolinate reductase n=1 Tax=Triparma retinervis TaxID=2557542 RepID=A0A9W7E0J0_9STRA|nr:hypothetical protein TrRE_jg848 [Triparma retinervis]
MPGPMATAAAEACLRKGMDLAPFCLTGPDIDEAEIEVTDPDTKRSQKVTLVPSSKIDGLVEKLGGVEGTVAIDYTHPSAVNGNGEFYVKNRIPFVMGTTGGDRDLLMETVTSPSPHYCVIAPNMGKQIVAMQNALEFLQTRFPASFEGYTLKVTESHQKKKADTSGTALAVIDSIKGMVGSKCTFQQDEINMLRDDASSKDFGVPEEYLDAGHAFHTYTLTSPDGSVEFELKHNVCGRRVYAEGTADAVKFLAKQVEELGEGGAKVFNMIDVLEAGAL